MIGKDFNKQYFQRLVLIDEVISVSGENHKTTNLHQKFPFFGTFLLQTVTKVIIMGITLHLKKNYDEKKYVKMYKIS